MKKLFLVCAILFTLSTTAQPGYITTVAGGASSLSLLGDGGPATAALLGEPSYAKLDGAGNIYISDNGNQRIRKVSKSTGIITTIGGGSTGLSDTLDGVPATASYLNVSNNLGVDLVGNVYFFDANKLRKIDAITGLISTIAGSYTAGYSGDGGPATAALFNTPSGVCVDGFGNIFVADWGNSVVRKINSAGIISTVAGGGTISVSDGELATAVYLPTYPSGVATDYYGNLYIADGYIHKVDPAGIITIVGGSGTSGGMGYGEYYNDVPATDALIGSSDVCVDVNGNIYAEDDDDGVAYIINTAGMIYRRAGAGSLVDIDSVPAIENFFNNIYGVAVDGANNLYIDDLVNNKIRMVYSTSSAIPSTFSSDSMMVIATETCSGISFDVITNNFSSGLHVKTYFGDGTMIDSTVSIYFSHGFVHFYDNYLPGTYTVKHVLLHGAMAVDSMTYVEHFTVCRNFPLQFYYDANANCMKDSGDVWVNQPVTVEVDSNGISIDTISAITGMNYLARGNVGDVYTFRVIENPPAFYPSCPYFGVVTDTIDSTEFPIPAKLIAMQCGSGSTYDLAINAVIPVTGVHDQWGNIYTNNYHCMPVDASVTLHYSPKYGGGAGGTIPAATSMTGNTITWSLASFSSASPPETMSYSLWWNGITPLTIGDTVQSYFTITPTADDSDTLNNSQLIIDTVKAGCDPNAMWVTPTCVPTLDSSTLLQYTINFENTGNDTAHNIYVMDTLPANVDFNSMRLVLASNIMYTTKFTDTFGHNIYKFDFPAINLLDSSHHGQCDGAVIFTIKSLPGLSTGTTINNHAGIFFDVNPVVMTNTAVTQMGGCIPTAANQLHNPATPELYPNPATNTLRIKTNGTGYDMAIINDVMGRQMVTKSLTGPVTTVDVTTLPSGVYYVTLKGENGVNVQQFVKL